MKVLKFGGSSVKSPENIKKVINIIKTVKTQDKNLAVVVSAFGGVTDQLIEISSMAAQGKKIYKKHLLELEKRHLNTVKELIPVHARNEILTRTKLLLNELKDLLHGIYLIKECSEKILDCVMSFGERLSAYIISESLNVFEEKTVFIDTREIIKTDNNFGSAHVEFNKTYKNISKIYKKLNNTIPVITGFIASTDKKETTTLGRGGSDFTASLFGAALNAFEIQIWTDVNGVMTADPKKVPNAFCIKSMTYEEAMELSHFGAKVIYPPTIQPAYERKIPIRIKNTFNPDHEGTFISDKKEKNGFKITGISSINNIALLNVSGSGMIGITGTAMRLFGALAKKIINIIFITQASSEHTVCFAVDPKHDAKARALIEAEFSKEIKNHLVDKVVIERNLSILAVVGENIKRVPGIAGKLFQALGNHNINIVAIAQGSSELNISFVVNTKDQEKTLQVAHNEFFQ